MANTINKVIPNINVPWENYSGEKIEEFIKKQLSTALTQIENIKVDKGSYLVLLNMDESGSSATVGIFASRNSYAEYQKNPEENANLVLSSIEIPLGNGGGAEASYIVKLINMGDKAITATSKDNLKVNVRFTSQLYDPSDKSLQDTNENAILQVETRMQDIPNASWKVAGTMSIQSQSTDNADAYTEIDLSPYVVGGTQSVRMIASGEVSERRTNYVNLSVTLTDVNITFQTNWQKPFEYMAASPTIQVPLLLTGTVDKTLHLKVTSEDGKYTREYEYNVGTTSYTETPYTASIDHPATHGIYNIEAWITSGESIKTTPVSQNIMCSLKGNKKPLLVLNNIGKFQNWSSVHAFDYVLYNPSGDNMSINFVLTNLDTSAEIFSESVQNVQSGVLNSLIFNLTVETEDNTNFPASMSFTSGGIVLRDPLRVPVDNIENFAPVTGADFFLDPKLRNNSESNPGTIINAVNNHSVIATFEGLTFVNDGWIVDSETNTRCLRLLDGQKVSINYDAYSEDTALQGLTIELDFATRNAANGDSILLQMGTPYALDNHLVGLWVKAQDSCFMTTQKRDEGAQNWTYCKDKRTHVAVNIVPNLYSQGVNYVRIFINGIISREFVYADTDKFLQSVDGFMSTGGIVIAPQDADIDIYGLRIYKKSLSSNDIRQNYLSTMSSIEEKKAFKNANAILGENGLISYAKAYDKYNTLLYKGDIPSLKRPDSTKGDLVIHKIGDPAHSGILHGMTFKGQGSTSKKYWTWNIQSDFKGDAETNYWEDENGENHGQCYQNAEGLPLAKKLVDKRNWASSMQSHKMGATKLYNDVYQKVIGKNEITSIPGKENCRVAVYEDPFLVFKQTEEDAEPVFVGMGTFGSGKADKPTFGYDKKVTPNMLMIEGSDNNPRLTKHQMPWIEGDVYYDEEEEGYVYKTSQGAITSWDYDMGNQETISKFIEAFNFIYSYSNRIKPFIGTLSQLNAADRNTIDTSYCYWVTKDEEGSAKYDMFTYNEISQKWVPGGTSKNAKGVYATLNVKEQLSAYLGEDFTRHETSLDWEKINDDFIKARKQVFTKGITTYFNKKDILYFMCMMKLIAASDNRAKNTYFWVKDSNSLIRAFQDDLDSILPVENQGQLKKPYWVEEHDLYEGTTTHYWNGSDNAFYNMMEECFASELRSTMNEILSAMANLGGGTVEKCWEKYFLSTQQYFPAVAYNEMARIGYEHAHYQMVNGNYNNDTDPITQSLGSQEEGERQWLKDRTIYMSSYAMYGEFNPSAPSGGNIIYRAIDNTDINYNLTMAMWLYPVATVGQSVILSGIRCRAGESISATGTPSDNTQSSVCGVNYMSDIGTWYDKPANGTFAFNGSRVKTLIAGSDNTSDIRLKATSLSLKPMKSLRKLDVHNLSTLKGVLDLSNNDRLESVDARGTSITGITLPKLSSIKSLKLPDTITEVSLDGLAQLSELTLEGWSNVNTLYINQETCPNISTLDIINNIKNNNNVSSLTILSINWPEVSSDALMWLLDKQAKLTGRITLSESVKVDGTLKMRMVGMWGNIDDEENSLYVSYNKLEIDRVSLKGYSYMPKKGSYTLKLSTIPVSGNDIINVSWKMTNTEFATIDAKTGVITVNGAGSKENDDKATVTVTLQLSSGKTLEASTDIYFYEYEAKLGDYVFANGMIGSDLTLFNSTPVGIIFYIEPKERKWGLIVSLKDIERRVWGLFNSTDETNGMNGIKLAGKPSFNVYNVPLLQEYTSGIDVSDSTMRNESNVNNDGFKDYGDELNTISDIGFEEITQSMYNTNVGYTILGEYIDKVGLKVGDMIARGQLNTLKIIAHRDHILSNSNVDLPIPKRTATQTLKQNLDSCISAVVSAHDNQQKWQQYYYPYASYCNAYVPALDNIGETLVEELSEGHWFAPSAGENSRISWYCMKGYTIGEANNIFAQGLSDLRFLKPNSWYWSSSEHSEVYSWLQGLSSGQVSYYGYGKCISLCCRPVAAFRLKA